ncbi:putative invertase inhibitor [Macadamia integrifolia]|uniref:putative invertase inhibitor n=1 Tax=Macadamia integrifolia TaxID=60698 RepID=UPI001C4E92C6|nr:putative invertase inhibitor [Macadamia integrifolia]
MELTINTNGECQIDDESANKHLGSGLKLSQWQVLFKLMSNRYDFCVAALEEDPKSHSADLQGLGFISLEMTKTNATKIGSRIDELLDDQKLGSDVKERLKDCNEIYSDAISHLKDATDALKSKDYKKANIEVSLMMDASSSCENGFKEKSGFQSPLSEENDFFQLTAIALSVTNLA